MRIIDDKIKLSQIKEKQDRHEKQEKTDNYFTNKIKKQASFPLIKTYKNIMIKSVEKYKKKKMDDSTLISENKIEAKNIVDNIIKSKKINYPRTTMYINKLKKQNRSDIFSYYDYKNILPLFKLSKIIISKEN